MLEKVLIRGNEEGVWTIRNPHMRAFSYAFAMFGLAETTEMDAETMKQEIREVTRLLVQVESPGERKEENRMSVKYTVIKSNVSHRPHAENHGAAMTLWLMSYINRRGEGLPIPGKLALSSPGSALTAEERKRAEELNKTDLIMSTTALDNIFKGMAGGKELPEEFMYNSRGIYDGVKDVYLSYGGDEVQPCRW